MVFPGGAIDPDDAQRAARWFGDEDQAARAGAVRELQEEAGLVVTAAGVLLASLDAVDAAPPSVDSLPQVSHWIAPEDVPVRFDARFFAVQVARGVEPVADGGEAERAWWARPCDLLEANASGGCTLYWPTMKVMEGLAGCAAVADVLAVVIPQEEPRVQVI